MQLPLRRATAAPNLVPTRRAGPPSDRLTVLAARALGRARSLWAVTSRGPVHGLEVRGSGRGTAVLFHGFSSTGAHLLALMRELRPAFARLVAPDLPAHGLTPALPLGSMRADVGAAAILEALDAWLDGPAVLVGSSLGGYVAVRAALEAPGHARALVLSSPAGAAMTAAELDAFRARFEVPTHRSAVAFVDRVMAVGPVARHALAWGVRRRFVRPELRALLASVRPDDLFTREDLARLSLPVLCLWGDRDRVMPTAARDFFASALPPHARFERLAALGHGPYLERPGAVARRIAAFVDGLEPAR
ncbi:MAG: alpha/beta fold hydrolase [Deltaproteobacteria bacterium]|nr:alpha/beta fold hydrolase [Deltaproteobacteria bacterium]